MIHSVMAAWFALAIWHPFHVSVCEIVYNKEEQALQIMQKVFLDDLEKGLATANDTTLDLLKDSRPVDVLLPAYLNRHLELVVNGKSTDFRYLGHEIEEDALWAYMEVKNVARLEKIRVRSTLLWEIYDDQTNLIHINRDGNIRSFVFREGDTAEETVY